MVWDPGHPYRWRTWLRSHLPRRASASAPPTVGPLARVIITGYDWRVAMLVIGNLAWLVSA